MISHQRSTERELRLTIRAGFKGGVLGGCCIWIYEAVVWVGVQHQMRLSDIPANATGLVFGASVREEMGVGAPVVGSLIHFGFSILWGFGFAMVWPALKRRNIEATLFAMAYAIFAWIAMHSAIAIVSSNHPNYLDPNVIIGGIMAHFFFSVPMALFIKHDDGRQKISSHVISTSANGPTGV